MRSPRRRRHLVPLAVDPVLVDELALQRPERVEPDVQRDGRALDAGRLERAEQVIGEVEPGRRGGGRSGWTGVDRLVALGRRRSVADVRRQRHLAGIGHDGVRVALEPDDAGAIGEPLPDLDAVAAPKADERARPRAGARGGRAPPTAAGRREVAGGRAPRRHRHRAARPTSRAGRTRESLTTSRSAGAQPAADVAEARVLRSARSRDRGRAGARRRAARPVSGRSRRAAARSRSRRPGDVARSRRTR